YACTAKPASARGRPLHALFPDHLAQTHRSTPAQSDSSYNAAPAGYSARETPRSREVPRASAPVMDSPASQRAYPIRQQPTCTGAAPLRPLQLHRDPDVGADPTPAAANPACCPVSMNSFALSTGVCCKIPCPKFKMCPAPPSAATFSSVASRTFSAGPNKIAGSRFPCSATRGPSVFRNPRKSWRQSTLKTSAPVLATALIKCPDAFV